MACCRVLQFMLHFCYTKYLSHYVDYVPGLSGLHFDFDSFDKMLGGNGEHPVNIVNPINNENVKMKRLVLFLISRRLRLNLNHFSSIETEQKKRKSRSVAIRARISSLFVLKFSIPCRKSICLSTS